MTVTTGSNNIFVVLSGGKNKEGCKPSPPMSSSPHAKPGQGSSSRARTHSTSTKAWVRHQAHTSSGSARDNLSGSGCSMRPQEIQFWNEAVRLHFGELPELEDNTDDAVNDGECGGILASPRALGETMEPMGIGGEEHRRPTSSDAKQHIHNIVQRGPHIQEGDDIFAKLDHSR